MANFSVKLGIKRTFFHLVLVQATEIFTQVTVKFEQCIGELTITWMVQSSKLFYVEKRKIHEETTGKSSLKTHKSKETLVYYILFGTNVFFLFMHLHSSSSVYKHTFEQKCPTITNITSTLYDFTRLREGDVQLEKNLLRYRAA